MPSKKLIYFGESLGSGVAVQMATERPPGLLMLHAPYTSVETRAAELCPFVIGVRHLVRDKRSRHVPVDEHQGSPRVPEPVRVPMR
jgi:hypothetical protein